MSHDFVDMINGIDFLYGFIYECANLVNNLEDYDNYNHLSVKLCNKFIIPIINITKKEHIKEHNEHINNIIDNLEYLEIKKFIDNNIDIIESTLAPVNDYFDLYKKFRNHYEEFDKKIIKSYFNIWYIKFFYLLHKDIKLNIHNINILMNIFINLGENSSIDCNKIHDLYNNIVHSKKYKNNTIFTVYK